MDKNNDNKQIKNKKRENVVCREHWLFLAGPVILGIILLGLAIFALVKEHVVISGICLVLCVIFGLREFLKYKFEYLSIEDGVVSGRTGIIRSTQLSTPARQVADIGLSNGLLGKIFRFHTITVANAGTANTEYTFKHMTNGKKFRDAVFSAQEPDNE